jgi:hypothetical protein
VQAEAAWALSGVASGTVDQAECVAQAMPALVHALQSPSRDVMKHVRASLRKRRCSQHAVV